MDFGTAFLIRLCSLEARVSWLRLTSDPPAPRWFGRAIMGAQILDRLKADGVDIGDPRQYQSTMKR